MKWLVQRRNVMTQITLGPLAFKYPDNMLASIFLNVLLKCAYFAEELKYFMDKLNVCPQTALFCQTFLILIILKWNYWIFSIHVIFQILSLWSSENTLVTFGNSFMCEKLKCSMDKLNVCQQTTLVCKILPTLFTLKFECSICHIIVIF